MSGYQAIDGERLRTLRQERMISQRDLATLAQIPQPTIAVLEGGKRRAQPKTVRRLAEALGVEPTELVLKEGGDE